MFNSKKSNAQYTKTLTEAHTHIHQGENKGGKYVHFFCALTTNCILKSNV